MEEVIQFFSKYKQLFVIVHLFSVVIGMGTALTSDVLFNVYIKDKKINPTENKTLQVLSRIVWIGLGFIVLSGFAIFLSDPSQYISSDKFLAKMTIVAVLILNGFLFWKITHKALRKISFTDTNIHHKYVRVRKLSFAFGAISVVSWLSAFVLGSMHTIPFSFGVTMSIYASVLVLAVIASQIMDYMITHKNK